VREFSILLLVQLFLALGMAGLFWPEKVKPVLETLMFPWYPTYRVVRVHSIASLGLSILLVLALIVRA
jgi:hypothetical protein